MKDVPELAVEMVPVEPARVVLVAEAWPPTWRVPPAPMVTGPRDVGTSPLTPLLAAAGTEVLAKVIPPVDPLAVSNPELAERAPKVDVPSVKASRTLVPPTVTLRDAILILPTGAGGS